jgi:hypothetical protein
LTAEEAKVTAEIIPLKRAPGGRLSPLVVMPEEELGQSLPIVALGVSRGPAFGRQVFEKPSHPFVFEGGRRALGFRHGAALRLRL